MAGRLVSGIKDGGVVCLYGDLGSGKTTFVKGLAKALGIKARIISPTFLIIRSYGRFYHIDLYRIDQPADLVNLGLSEILSDDSNIVVIEWPEKIHGLLPVKRIDVYFEIVDEKTRQISIKERN